MADDFEDFDEDDTYIRTGSDIDWDNLNVEKTFSMHTSSTCVAYVTYQPVFQTLFIQFTKDGTAYEYSGVEPWVVFDLVRSSSVGRYFNYHIRMEYAYEQLYGRSE